MRTSWILKAWILLFLGVPGAAVAAPPLGIGVLGDSYCDEYQFYPPDRSTARNWVEILAATRSLNFGRFTTDSRGEPRNQGYEYNWARSDATTDDLIRTGQHTGLAAQVARGEVQVVYVSIGGNDFIGAMKAADPLPALEEVLPRAIENYREAVETVLAAHSDARLILATLPDIRYLPEFAGPIRSGQIPAHVADRFTAAMKQFNDRIRTITASNPRVALIDFDLTAKLANLIDQSTICIAGVRLDREQPRNDLGHFFLADSRHPGTLGQGLIAQVFIETLNTRFDAGIQPLTNDELVRFARATPPSSRWTLQARGADPSSPAGLE